MLLNDAIKLAERGIYIFPINVHDKSPMTAHGFKDATTDIKQIREWFTDVDADKVGVAANLHKSGLVCLDIDNGHNGTDDNVGTKEAGKLMKQHPDFNLSAADYVEYTQSGGYHMLYKNDDKNLKKINVTDHIELLVDSVVIAPTKNYEIIDHRELSTDIRYAPKWLVMPENNTFKEPNRQVFYNHKRTIGMALDCLYKPVPQGERHNTLVTATCSFFATGADADTIRNLVFTAGETMDLDYQEIENIWNWACKKAMNQLTKNTHETEVIR